MQNLFNEDMSQLKIENPLTYSQILGNIYYILQVHLIKNLSIGNIYIDTLLQFFILSIVINIIIYSKYIIYYIFLLSSSFINYLVDILSLKIKNITITNKSQKLYKSIKFYLEHINREQTLYNNYDNNDKNINFTRKDFFNGIIIIYSF
jgi:hypothetical protein